MEDVFHGLGEGWDVLEDGGAFGTGESSSMSSSSLLISIGLSSSPATTDEVTEEAEEEDVTEEPLLEARTAMEGMVGPTAVVIGTESMTTS